ncbi:hypothetical protein HY642_04650 [Candidatus Woesearchaeota archaeon]|nr:hypothetical protein [Candidatus Woesearchaeota archaeon]
MVTSPLRNYAITYVAGFVIVLAALGTFTGLGLFESQQGSITAAAVTEQPRANNDTNASVTPVVQSPPQYPEKR